MDQTRSPGEMSLFPRTEISRMERKCEVYSAKSLGRNRQGENETNKMQNQEIQEKKRFQVGNVNFNESFQEIF